MKKLITNRDLYLAAQTLLKSATNNGTLERYLGKLYCCSTALSKLNTVSLDQFFTLLEHSFADMQTSTEEIGSEQSQGYIRWENTIRRQIAALREMEVDRTFQNELRYFGTASPGGEAWYNFDTQTFIECGLAGAFGGWGEPDEAGQPPVKEIENLSWDDLTRFLECGQYYE